MSGYLSAIFNEVPNLGLFIWGVITIDEPTLLILEMGDQDDSNSLWGQYRRSTSVQSFVYILKFKVISAKKNSCWPYLT